MPRADRWLFAAFGVGLTAMVLVYLLIQQGVSP